MTIVDTCQPGNGRDGLVAGKDGNRTRGSGVALPSSLRHGGKHKKETVMKGVFAWLIGIPIPIIIILYLIDVF